MGVLESIKVKQVNFPRRMKYGEFYKEYELLSPAYGKGRYDLLSDLEKEQRGTRQYTQDIVERVLAPLEPEEYQKLIGKSFALGQTKIMQMNEIKDILNASKKKAVSI